MGIQEDNIRAAGRVARKEGKQESDNPHKGHNVPSLERRRLWGHGWSEADYEIREQEALGTLVSSEVGGALVYTLQGKFFAVSVRVQSRFNSHGYHDVTLVAESGDLEVFRAGSSFQAGQEIRDAAQRYIRKTL
jgi:hypothetical protein